MTLPECPLYHGSMLCNICIRSGRDFTYTFCKLYSPKKGGSGARCSRTVEGEPSKPPLQAWILNSPLAGLSGRLALDVREQRAPLT